MKGGMVVEASQLFGFWWVAFLLTLTPGSDWAFVISAGVRGRSALPSIAGMLAGYAAIVAAIAIGFGAVVASQPQLLTAITVLGSCYLGWNGLRSWRAAGTSSSPALSAGDTGWARFFARGAGVTSVNPKGIMLLLVLLPQFTSNSATFAPTLQLLILGSLFIACIAVVYAALALISNRVLSGRPVALQLAGRVSGVAMMVLAVVMIGHRLLP